ncbi:3-hydroxyacyl-CoA dehydrogenase [Rhodovulum iodosum]|uniref:3-hydroxyacyl-CoA dehydrogenase n=1 Tax=Rhodovulum iodosum TaxID=68291 RepID=A0ABV3XNB2_9RHOB|nr:enoyl-CoA hydratase-related protein [Rhodovulum robiginosum]RSK34711.1 3-hydroxyacyl-CoA dehydrogenase [Rhodovulum robiginosum]
MGQAARFELSDGGVGRIVLSAPPFNMLTEAMRAGLDEALAKAHAAPGLKALLIGGEGRGFSAGVEPATHDAPPHGPALHDLCARLEALDCPVIALLHGSVSGAGLELALAAHYRVAAAGTHMALPDITLGLPPSAGATQRLPRLIGAEPALEMMLVGKPVAAPEAARLGLVDRVFENDLGGSAMRFAEELIAEGRPPRRLSEVAHLPGDSAAALQALKRRRAQVLASPMPAPGKIVDCVEAALLLPFEAGLAFERAAYEDCRSSDASRAQRHAFLAERRAARPARAARPRPLRHVAIAGADATGVALTAACLDAGLDVALYEENDAALAGGVERLDALYSDAVSAGRLDHAARAKSWARLAGATRLEALGGADMLIETGLRRDPAFYRRLGRVLRADACLASATEAPDLDRLAAGSGRPADAVGLHPALPISPIRLVEVVPGARTGPEAVATAFALAQKLGAIPLSSGIAEGFVARAVLSAALDVADALLEEGATPYQVDSALVGYGFARGLYRLVDTVGLDHFWEARRRQDATRPAGARYVEIADRLCEAGRLGVSTGRGYYLYPEGAGPAEDPDMAARLAEERAAKGIRPRTVPEGEIVQRVLAAMANTGARLVEGKIARRPSDVDVAAIHGFGFPRWRGGPMEAADLAGLLRMRSTLRVLAEDDPVLWTPAPLFDDLIKNGRHFADLNG